METQLHAVINKPGDYTGFSANYSGAGFSDMHFQFAGMPSNDFDAWIAKLKASDESLDAAAYEQLAKPSTREPVRHYAHVPAGLYPDIAMQYMTNEVDNPTEYGDNCSKDG